MDPDLDLEHIAIVHSDVARIQEEGYLPMNVSDYLDLLRELGIDVDWVAELKVVNSGRALRRMDGSRVSGSIYFNRNEHHVVHFTINDRHRIPDIDWSLWKVLPDDEIKKKDHGKPNILPVEGRERQTLRQLLVNA